MRVLVTGMSGTGKSTVAAELERVLADRREIEPLLLAAADLVIDTRQPVPAVVAAILDLVATAASGAE